MRLGSLTRMVRSVEVVYKDPAFCHSPVICRRCPTSKRCNGGIEGRGTAPKTPLPALYVALYPLRSEVAVAVPEDVDPALVVPSPELRPPI